jgi:hypothetical protein
MDWKTFFLGLFDGDIGNSEAYAKIFEENRYVLSVFLGMLVQVEFSY